MRIALLGIYGGLARAYNPGSFMIAYQTYRALKERLPGSEIDIYCTDSFWQQDGIGTEEIDGLTIRYFNPDNFEWFVDTHLSGYHGLVLGGDNLWTIPPRGPLGRIRDAVLRRDLSKRSIFFLGSGILNCPKGPVLAVNCVASRSGRGELAKHRRTFERICGRSEYVSVRDRHLYETLTDDFGLTNIVHGLDPVLGLRPLDLPAVPSKLRIERGAKPTLGIAVGPSFVRAFVEVYQRLSTLFTEYDVWFYAYSQKHYIGYSAIRHMLPPEAKFIYEPLSPAQAFNLTGQFDLVLNDMYHGTIAVIIHGKPFIPIRFRDAEVSRRTDLFDQLGVPDRSIRIVNAHRPIGHDQNVQALMQQLPDLLTDPVRISSETLNKARSRVELHFDRIRDVFLNQ